jgi:hypothetical protein
MFNPQKSLNTDVATSLVYVPVLGQYRVYYVHRMMVTESGGARPKLTEVGALCGFRWGQMSSWGSFAKSPGNN